jgi:hypothetical protein
VARSGGLYSRGHIETRRLQRAEVVCSDEGVTAYILRKVGDPEEVVAFGLFEGTREELEALRPDEASENARHARMDPHIESQFADGVYEVVEVYTG